jgi:hypothetical protein
MNFLGLRKILKNRNLETLLRRTDLFINSVSDLKRTFFDGFRHVPIFGITFARRANVNINKC